MISSHLSASGGTGASCASPGRAAAGPLMIARPGVAGFGGSSDRTAAILQDTDGQVLRSYAEPEARSRYWPHERAFRELVLEDAMLYLNLKRVLGTHRVSVESFVVFDPDRPTMMIYHSHHCMQCGQVVGFSCECEEDDPHLFEYCGDCASAQSA